jgi:hypothetical protein
MVSGDHNQYQKPIGTTHLCVPNSPDGAYGPAIDECNEDDEGRFWVGNGEYESQVNYCPVCGMKAPRQIEETT